MPRQIIKFFSIIIIFMIAFFILVQFIPLGKDHINPPVLSEPNWDSQKTHALVKIACFDCHSNETVWPWYSNIAPVSWLIYYDVINGRQIINFSDWNITRLGESGDISAAVNEGEMPPIQYLLIHPSARLSAPEKTQLIDGLIKSLGH